MLFKKLSVVEKLHFVQCSGTFFEPLGIKYNACVNIQTKFIAESATETAYSSLSAAPALCFYWSITVPAYFKV